MWMVDSNIIQMFCILIFPVLYLYNRNGKHIKPVDKTNEGQGQPTERPREEKEICWQQFGKVWEELSSLDGRAAGPWAIVLSPGNLNWTSGNEFPPHLRATPAPEACERRCKSKEKSGEFSQGASYSTTNQQSVQQGADLDNEGKLL